MTNLRVLYLCLCFFHINAEVLRATFHLGQHVNATLKRACNFRTLFREEVDANDGLK